MRPRVQHVGTPVFRGTRVPVQTLFDYSKRAIQSNASLSTFPVFREARRLPPRPHDISQAFPASRFILRMRSLPESAIKRSPIHLSPELSRR